MPRVHHRKAGKDYPTQGIKKGEMHYTWHPRGMPWLRSKTRPRQSQLTTSPFLSAVYQAGERLEDLTMKDNILETIEEMVSELEELKDECEENLDNIPWDLQDSHILTERIPDLESFISELEAYDFEDQEFDDEGSEEAKEWKDEKENVLADLQQVCYQGE